MLSYYHYDPYSQALAKIERGHAKDLADVAQLIDRGLVGPTRPWIPPRSGNDATTS